jgi:phage recombination protein Bet
VLPAIRKDFTPEQVDLIKTTIAKGATDDELRLFLYTCQRTGLDPMARQIYAIKRYSSRDGGDVMAIQTGIDGYRLTAQRTGLHAGTDDVVYSQNQSGNLLSATVTVYKIIAGQRVGFTATARWDEYCARDRSGNLTPMWAKMPFLMLGKCAEALALRKAFPAELSGVYTTEEMQQADVESTPATAPAQVTNSAPSSAPVNPPADSQNGGENPMFGEIEKMLMEMCENDAQKSADMLEGLTAWKDKKGKDVAGKREVRKLNSVRRGKVSQLQVVHSKVKKEYDAWKGLAKGEAQDPGDDDLEI